MKLKYTLDACVYCVAFVANGDEPEDRPNLKQEIDEHLGLKAGEDLVNAAGLDERGKFYRDDRNKPIKPEHSEYEAYCEDWFAWSGCECCGSNLGGNRNRLAVLAEVKPRKPSKKQMA